MSPPEYKAFGGRALVAGLGFEPRISRLMRPVTYHLSIPLVTHVGFEPTTFGLKGR